MTYAGETASCPKCGHEAVVTANPPRYSLPKFHGTCGECGHEWNFNPPVDEKRYGQS